MELGAETVPTRTVEAETGDGAGLDLRSSQLYDNRELSWLDFNERVLELAEDEDIPLLERAKFLAIWASNLDEFYMVRVAGLHDQVDAGIDARGPDGLSPSETIERIAERMAGMADRHAHQFERLRPAMAEHGIRVVDCSGCNTEELAAVDRLFAEQIFPVLTPLAVGPGRPFPYISNLSLSLAVWLRDPESGTRTFARVKVPKEVLPRFMPIDGGTFVTLESMIARHLDELFPGMEVLRHDYFRVTRDADFTVSDEADDLLSAVEHELRQRRFGEVVRLEVAASMDPDLRELLVESLKLEEEEVVDVDGMLDLVDLWELHGLEGHKDLHEPPWTPVSRGPFSEKEGEKPDVFAAIREDDLLVHHPYDSFASSVERFVAQAVEDPNVLAIKMTVYRTSDDSALVPRLIEAAELGKQAVCLLELKARFDERRNIGWARALEEAGVHVVHGLPGLKTHAKALLIVRREGSGLRNYVHIGTGNYHAKTARIYEDLGLFTCDGEITSDVAELFNALTGAARSPTYRKVLVAPEFMRDRLLNEIERTIDAHRAGEDARIVMKMNSLVDPRCIRALYEASRAGVPVDLNVRGICCLRPGVPGVSDNIRVVSVVGRFLEHSRIYAFHRGAERQLFMGSADLMPRNLDTRVELLAPVEEDRLRDELQTIMERCLADNTFAWELRADGTWERRSGRRRSAQQEFMAEAAERASAET
jgi:polyphosphate kinase